MANVESGSERAAPTADHKHSVHHFLDRFGQALTAGRADVVARMWETPGYVLGDQEARGLSSPTEVKAFFAGAKTQYDARGIIDTRAEIVREEWLTEQLVVVEARWLYLDATSHEVGHEIATYTLRLDATGTLRLRVAVMHGASAPH